MFNRIRAISQIAKKWLDPQSVWHRQAVQKLSRSTRQSPGMISASLQSIFAEYHQESLSKLNFAKTLSSRKILVILPSNVLAPAWQATTMIWLAGKRAVLKPSCEELVFAALLKKSIPKSLSSVLPLEIISPRHLSKKELQPFDRMIVYGSDETVQYLQHLAPPKVIGFDTRISLAIITSSRHSQTLLESAARDLILYESQGCLTPQAFFVLDRTRHHQKSIRFAKQLSKVIATFRRRWPPAPEQCDSLWKEESFFQKWSLRQSQKLCLIYPSIQNPSILFSATLPFEPLSRPRTAWVIPVKRLDDIPGKCGLWWKRLSTLAMDQMEERKSLSSTFRSPSIRYCSLGLTHQTAPDWKNGGVDLLACCKRLKWS